MDADAINHTSFLIIQSAIQIHKAMGPGLLESAYRTCMIHELRERGLTVESERIIPVRYKGLTLDGGYRIDLLVQDEVIVELKSVEAVLPVHQAQVLSYLRLTGKSWPANQFQCPSTCRRRKTDRKQIRDACVLAVLSVGFVGRGAANAQAIQGANSRPVMAQSVLYLRLVLLVRAVGAKPTER